MVTRISSGIIESPRVNPGEALPFSLDLNEKMLKPGKEYHLNIQALTNDAAPMVPSGHVVATEQFCTHASAGG